MPDAAERAGRDQAALLLETAAAARAVGEPHRAVALLRSALEVLRPGRRDPEVRARVHYTLAQAMVRVEDDAGAYRESAAAMALVPAQPPSEARTWAAATHARMSYSVGRSDEADAAAEEALAAADALGFDGAWADIAVTQVRAAAGRRTRQPVRARLDEALARARRSGDVEVEMRVLLQPGDRRRSRPAGSSEALDWTRRGTRRARDLGVEWSYYPAELRHLQVTALYMAGDWDGSLAEADVLARVPDMSAHVRADGLLVLVGRGDPAARERIDWARGLIPRLSAHVLLDLVTAGAEIDLAAWEGDAAGRPSTSRWRRYRRLRQEWDDDHLGDAAAGRHGARARGATPPSPRAGDGDAAAADRLGAGRARSWPARRPRPWRPTAGRTATPWASRRVAWLARVEAEAARVPGRGRRRSCGGPRSSAFGFGHVYEEARSRWRLAEALLADRRPGRGRRAGRGRPRGRRPAGCGAAADRRRGAGPARPAGRRPECAATDVPAPS